MSPTRIKALQVTLLVPQQKPEKPGTEASCKNSGFTLQGLDLVCLTFFFVIKLFRQLLKTGLS